MKLFKIYCIKWGGNVSPFLTEEDAIATLGEVQAWDPHIEERVVNVATLDRLMGEDVLPSMSE